MHFYNIFYIISAFVCAINCSVADFSPAGSRLNADLAEDESIVLEPINGTKDFRINSKKDQDDKPWFDGRDLRFIHCVRPAKCEKLLNNTCFGSKLPYSFTSLALTESLTQEESREKLYNYEALRNIPKCWAVIQPFLCAVFAPKCERIKNRDMVFLPSLEMCRITSEPCRILYNTSFFPEFLKCSETFFPSKCNNDVREMKFNAMGQCLAPLVQSESSTNYYKDIEGCGVQCKDPLYTEEEHDGVHTLIGWGASLCFICNFFVIATFLIHDWKKSKHPAWIIFYINICFLFNWIGWFMQFISGNRENIVCRRDGTLRHSEPSAGENLSCIIPFILIYYFLIAAMVWFTIFTYAWHLQTTNRGNIRDRIDKKSSYFHLIAWSFPLVLTITIMALSEVDGNSITGICFVGYRDHSIRIGLVLVPIGVLSLISIFFSLRGMFQLFGIKKCMSSNEESKKLHSFILRMGIRTILSLVFIGGFFIFQIYEFRNSESWAESLNDLIICKIKSTYSDVQTTCKLKTRPSVAILQLRLLCLFGTCFAISSWCWTAPTFKTWSRFIRKKIGHDTSDDEKFTKPKHKVIADAYAKRLEGVISVSIQNSHTDPAGLNFDMNNLNSTESIVMGTTLTNYLLTMINRRNAVTSLDFQEPTCAPCASSCDSEISVSVRHINVSVGSRRSSVDSQVSVQMSETEIKAKVESRSQKHKGVNMKTKNRKRNFYASSKRTNRRASSSSIESQIITTAQQKIKCHYPNNKIRLSSTTAAGSQVIKNRQTERRSACTDFDNDIKTLINRNKIHPISLTTSDDDTESKGSPEITHKSHKMHMQHTEFNMSDNDSTDSHHIVNEKNGYGYDQSLHPIIQKFLLNTNSIPLESLLKSGHDRNADAFNATKNSRNSMKSNKSRQSRKPAAKIQELSVLSSSLSSSSSIELDMPFVGVHTSYSGTSVGGGGNKTHSRNSKGSCDVGIQANAYDIASHTRSYDDLDKDNLTEKLHPNYNADDDFDEMHQLLPPCKKRELSIVSRKDTHGLSDTEKLKMLLLPST